MDHVHPMDGDFGVDLESGEVTKGKEDVADPALGSQVEKLRSEFVNFDGLIRSEREVNLTCSNGIPVEDVKMVSDKKVEVDEAGDLGEDKLGKERRKTASAKKPPRPPKALSLDAADQKLIKEIRELAMMKRARIERMRALRKMKDAKASTSTGNLFTVLFTIIFFLLIMFQGIASGRSSTISFQGSPESAQVADHGNTSASHASIPDSGSPSLLEQLPDAGSGEIARRAAG